MHMSESNTLFVTRFFLAQEWKSSEEKIFDESWFWEEMLSLAGPIEEQQIPAHDFTWGS